jgi:hypothetical protein
MIRNSAILSLLCVAVVACGDQAAGPTPEQIETRDVAARQACISARLAQRAADELETLEQMTGNVGVIAFQRAYEQHATLRLAAYAQLDSAVNHSPTPEDSARHAAIAEGFQIRAPGRESVEENVIRSYETNFAVIFNDPDHPCNWESELNSPE